VSQRHVSATELAKLAVCEQQLVVDKQRGKRLSKAQKEAIAAGREEHAGHHRQVQYYQQLQDKRCFIATAVFGPDALQTRQLRDFRDRVLKRFQAGRSLIRCYYRYSPALAHRLRDKPVASYLTRALLSGLLWLINHLSKPPSC
jgi:hypothetical protein